MSISLISIRTRLRFQSLGALRRTQGCTYPLEQCRARRQSSGESIPVPPPAHAVIRQMITGLIQGRPAPARADTFAEIIQSSVPHRSRIDRLETGVERGAPSTDRPAA